MAFTLGKASRSRLIGVHPDLVRVVELAIALTPVDFRVIEGLRSAKRQSELVAAGASKTLNSRHLTGHAADLAPLIKGKVSWAWPLYEQIAPAVKQAAADLGIPIVWGGDWKTFRDGPHWELPRSRYPNQVAR